MADENTGKGLEPPRFDPHKRTKNQRSYFFLEGNLYQVVRENRAQNLLVARDFTNQGLKHFILSDAKKHMKPAYDTVEVAKMLNRTRSRVQVYVTEKKAINSPVRIYQKGKNIYGAPFERMKWSEDDILALHDYLLNLGSGRPRKDGTLYSAANIPSRRELLAMLRQQPMFYMQTSDGEFVPVWSAYDEV